MAKTLFYYDSCRGEIVRHSHAKAICADLAFLPLIFLLVTGLGIGGGVYIHRRTLITILISLVFIAVIAIAAVLGFALLNTPTTSTLNASTNVSASVTAQPSILPTPTATPTPTPSGQEIVVSQGQVFPIALLSNPSTGYHWQPTFDTGALALRNQTFTSNATATPLPGAGGTEVFTFQALRVGTTSITFDYLSPAGAVTQSTNYTIVVR